MSTPIVVEHPLVFEPGLYFGLSDDLYHGALALSSGGIRHMRVSTMNYWAESPLNPEPEPRDSDALRIGRLYDKRIIEGKEAFYELYAPELDPKAHPKALRTNDELKGAILVAGGPEKGIGTLRKADLIAKLAEYDPEAEVWETLLTRHAEQHPNREFVPFKLIRQIELAAAMIENHGELRRAFTGGMPQVSVFWRDEETGVPCKVRFDYLKPMAVVDLKTLANQHQLPIKLACSNAIAAYRYNIQAAFYLRGLEQAKRFAAEGRVSVADGTGHDGLVKGLAAAVGTPGRFLFVMQQKGTAPVALGRWFDEGPAMDTAREDIRAALAKFAECWTRHGAEQPWIVEEPIDVIDHYEFPAYLAAA